MALGCTTAGAGPSFPGAPGAGPVPAPVPAAAPAAGGAAKNAADPRLAQKLAAYQVVEFRQLKAGIETYAHKKVAYEGVFLDFSATFPQYVQDSGFRPNKVFWLAIQDLFVPVMAKKDSDLNTLIGGLKQLSKVKVYGTVAKFRKEPELAILPRYYVELDHLTVLTDGLAPAPAGGAATPPVGAGK